MKKLALLVKVAYWPLSRFVKTGNWLDKTSNNCPTFTYRAPSNACSCGYFKRPSFPSRSAENRESPWSFEKLSAVSWLLYLDGQTYLFIELDRSIGAPGERRLLSSERQAFVTPQNWETPLENENYLLQETVAWINQELVRGYSYETKLTFE